MHNFIFSNIYYTNNVSVRRLLQWQISKNFYSNRKDWAVIKMVLLNIYTNRYSLDLKAHILSAYL